MSAVRWMIRRKDAAIRDPVLKLWPPCLESKKRTCVPPHLHETYQNIVNSILSHSLFLPLVNCMPSRTPSSTIFLVLTQKACLVNLILQYLNTLKL